MRIESALCAFDVNDDDDGYDYNEAKKNKFEIYMHLGQLSEIIQSVDDGHSFPQNDSLHDTIAIAGNTRNHQNQTRAAPSTRSHSHTTTIGISRIAIETQYVVNFIFFLSLAQKLISSAR